MDNIDIVEKLFLSKRKLDIIECGCASMVSNFLMSIPGSSAFVNKSMQPYSRESQVELIGEYSCRAVSKEFIVKFLNIDDKDKIVLSFQVGNEKIHTHGFIGLKYNKEIYIYHISVNRNFDEKRNGNDLRSSFYERKIYLNHINKAAISILYHHNALLDLTIFDIIGKSTIDLHVIDENMQWVRMEEICRKSKGLILMRGSFNPYHHGHHELLTRAIAKYPDYTPCYHVSMQRFDKPTLTTKECLDKIVQLTPYGHPIIFSGLPRFVDTLKILRKRWDIPVVMPVGTDTVNRFIQEENKIDTELCGGSIELMLKNKGINTRKDNLEWKNSKFLVFPRQNSSLDETWTRFDKIIEIDDQYKDDGISSTALRNGTAIETAL